MSLQAFITVGLSLLLLPGYRLTALDIADACGAIRIAAVLEQHGGKRTTESAQSSSQPS